MCVAKNNKNSLINIISSAVPSGLFKITSQQNLPAPNPHLSNIYPSTGGEPAAAAAAAVAMITVVVGSKQATAVRPWPAILNSYVDFYVVVLHRSSSWLFRRSRNHTGCRIGRNRSGFAKFLEFRAGINTLALEMAATICVSIALGSFNLIARYKQVIPAS